MQLMLGRDLVSQQNVYLDAAGSRAVLICGKRGSGKSYTLGVFIEELIAVGKKDVIPVIIDPMGIYHTMVMRNDRQSSELYRWGLPAQSFSVRLLIPGVSRELYDRDILDALQQRGVECVEMRLNPSDLSPDGWCDLFNVNINQPLGIALFRAVQRLSKTRAEFTIEDIIATIEDDDRAQDVSKEALINRLEAADGWHLFNVGGYQAMDHIFRPGMVNIVDLSRLESGARGRRNLILSVIARNLFRAEPVWVMVDEEQVGRALYSLFGHAEKYAREGGRLHFTVIAEDEAGERLWPTAKEEADARAEAAEAEVAALRAALAARG